MRCINCGIATARLRRYAISSLPELLLTILAGWLTIEVPMDANICHPCFELLSSDAAGDARLFGHTMVCITCGCSVATRRRYHVVERNHSMLQNLPRSHPAFHQVVNYACHACWVRHQRQAVQDQNRLAEPQPRPGLEPEAAPESEPEIILPTYKRLANTSRHCLFNNCVAQQLHVIPRFLKRMLITKHNLYVPHSARVCETHMTLDVWHVLTENNNLYSSFTANQIEDLISITKSEQKPFNFENVTEMESVICHYWTGLTIVNFLNLFNSLPALDLRRPKHALALYLAKLRTGEPDRRLASLFAVSRPTLTFILKKVRSILTQYFVPTHLGTNHITHVDIVNRNLSVPNALFGNTIENRPAAIAIFDGTYVFIQKSSNYLYQKKTYSLHKYDN